MEQIDLSITDGPGLRWPVQGPMLTFHLAGGQGGMAHMLDHFGPSLQSPWTRLVAAELTPGCGTPSSRLRPRGRRSHHRRAGGRARRGRDRGAASTRSHMSTPADVYVDRAGPRRVDRLQRSSLGALLRAGARARDRRGDGRGRARTGVPREPGPRSTRSRRTSATSTRSRPGEQLEVRSWVIGATGKLLWIWHELWAGGSLRATEEILGLHVDTGSVSGTAGQHPVPRRGRRARSAPRWSHPARTRPAPSAWADERCWFRLRGARRGPAQSLASTRRPSPQDARLVAGRGTPPAARCAAAPSRWGRRTPRPCPATARGRSARWRSSRSRSTRTREQRAFAAFVDGHRPRHRRRALRMVVRLRRRSCPPTLRDSDRAGRGAVVGGGRRRLVARSPRAPAATWRTAQDHPVVHVSWHDAARLLPRGPGSGCPPRPSGSTPRAAASTRRPLPLGRRADARRRRHALQHLAGQLPDAQHPRRRLVRHRAGATPSQPNGYGLFNAPATSGSGARTGSTRTTTSRPATTRTARPAAQRVIRGGSYLCHDSYPHRNRPAPPIRRRRLSCRASSSVHVEVEVQSSVRGVDRMM